jgi:asparagine synthase (glutamine-hydrolysing)
MDHPLIEWMATLPSNLKVRGNEGKFLLKQSMRDYLPHELMYRPKQGFAVPLCAWFRGPLKGQVRSVVLGPRLAATGLFNARYLHHLVDAHISGTRDYSAPLWSLLMFDGFLLNVLGDTAVGAEARAA